MRRTTFALAAAAAAVLAGCSSTPLPPTTTPAATTPTAATSTTAQTPATSANAVKPVVVPPSGMATAVAGAPNERSVYFDFDTELVKTEYRPLLEQHGKVLVAKGQAIRVEGNADERGSAEYNLSLGQRRAQAVASVLRANGVKDSQLEVVSWGKEKPKATGHDESAWAQNRRADLVYR